jgi:hypothetical protein
MYLFTFVSKNKDDNNKPDYSFCVIQVNGSIAVNGSIPFNMKPIYNTIANDLLFVQTQDE